RLDGHTWGVPLAFKSVVLLYDPALVATPPTTTDELVAQAKAISGDGRYGLAYQATEPYFAAAWLHAFGSRAIDADGQVHLDTDARARPLASARNRAVAEHIAPQQPAPELATQLYRDGRGGFVIGGPWFAADAPRPIAAPPLPRVSGGGDAPAEPYLTVDAA